MIKQCKTCGKEFVTYQSLIKVGKGKFCSRACSNVTDNKKVSRRCKTCSKDFETTQDRIKNGRGKFCSRPCFEKNWSKRIPGWNKGKPAYWAKGNQYRKGKSNPNPHKMFGADNHKWIEDRTKLKGTNSKERRSSAYVTWRKEVRGRDNFKCQLESNECKGRIEVHHIESFTEFPELRHRVDNGITLCHYHHPRKRKDEDKMRPIFKEMLRTN